MLEDNIIVGLMALRAGSAWTTALPVGLQLAYVFPYASFHEARSNWRPMMFAKYFPLVNASRNTADVVASLVAPNVSRADKSMPQLLAICPPPPHTHTPMDVILISLR
jgi:hypothetical protein